MTGLAAQLLSVVKVAEGWSAANIVGGLALAAAALAGLAYALFVAPRR